MAQTYTQAEAKALSHKYASGDIEAARTEISRELNIPSEQVKHLDAAVRVETHKTANPNWNKPTIIPSSIIDPAKIETPKIELASSIATVKTEVPTYWTPPASKGYPMATSDGGKIYYNKNAVYGKYNGSIPTDAVIVYPDGFITNGSYLNKDGTLRNDEVARKVKEAAVLKEETVVLQSTGKPISEGGKWPTPEDWYAAHAQQAQYLRKLASQWIAENPAAKTTAPADDWRLQADDIDAMSTAFRNNGVTAQTPTYDPAYIKATAEWQAWRVANFPARTGKPYVAQTIPGAGEERKPLF
jgi:hypothetical protein